MRKANSAVTPERYPVIFLTTVCAIVFALLGCTLLAVLSSPSWLSGSPCISSEIPNASFPPILTAP